MEKKQKKFRQYRSNQGRSPERTEKVYQGCLMTLILGSVTLTCYAIYYLITI